MPQSYFFFIVVLSQLFHSSLSLSSGGSLDYLGRFSYLSLIFFVTLHSDGYIFPFLLCLSLLFFFQLASSDKHIAFLHFFFLGMVLITASCTVLQTSIHSFLGTLSIRSKLLNIPLHHMLSLGISVYFNFFCIF